MRNLFFPILLGAEAVRASAHNVGSGSRQNFRARAAANDALPTPTMILSPRQEQQNPAPSEAASSCPETYGASPMYCAAAVCGGEKPDAAGQCQQGGCKCAAGSGEPALTTVVTTQDGTAVTATYALQTISSYTNLREPMTTTLSGSSGGETAAAVVLAGGVVWWLSGFVGEAAIAETIQPPSEAEGHDSDKTCPNPQSECSKCTGVAGICTTGDAAGCTCKGDEKCPKDKQPKCSDTTCMGGDDKKCTLGDKCDCKADECPTEDDKKLSCSDDKCKGDKDNKCTIGDKCDCKSDSCPKLDFILACSECGGSDAGSCKEKECPCVDTTQFTDEVMPFTVQEADEFAAEFDDLPDITDASYASDNAEDAVCLKLGWGAPQRDEDAKNGDPSVTSSIDSWCKEAGGKEVGGKDIKDTVYKGFPNGNMGYWLSADYITGGDGCGDKPKIDTEECKSLLTDAMITCDPNSGETKGASLKGSCLRYNITVSAWGPDNGQRPPWDELPKDQIPTCKDFKERQHSLLQANLFEGIYPAFCKDVESNGKDKGLKKSYNPDVYTTPRKRSLMPRTPPPNPKSDAVAGYKINFEWTGPENSNEECRKDCTQAFRAIHASPCGAPATVMAYEAQVSVGCGTYSYSIDADLHQCGVTDSFLEGYEMQRFNVDYAKRAIEEFCGDETKSWVVDPAQPQQPEGTFTQFPGESNNFPSADYRYGDKKDEEIINIYVTFGSAEGAGNGGCMAPKKFEIKDDRDRCRKVLNQILDDRGDGECPGGTGGVIRENSEHGCVWWQMWQSKSKYAS